MHRQLILGRLAAARTLLRSSSASCARSISLFQQRAAFLLTRAGAPLVSHLVPIQQTRFVSSVPSDDGGTSPRVDSFEGTIESPDGHEHKNDDNEESLRNRVFSLALDQVHEHGWTDKAVVQALVQAKLPLTLSGMVSSPADLVQYFMDDCHRRLQEDLAVEIKEWKNLSSSSPTLLSSRLYTALKLRLEYVVPYVQSGRWHEGMALGATRATRTTAGQLHDMVNLVADSIVQDDDVDATLLGPLERAGIGSIYVATELHLLTTTNGTNSDDSPAAATWEFLKARVEEWEQLRALTLRGTSSDAAVAASAVVRSLGGAVVSLLQPAVRQAVSSVASAVLSNRMQPPTPPGGGGQPIPGTRPSDYETK